MSSQTKNGLIITKAETEYPVKGHRRCAIASAWLLFYFPNFCYVLTVMPILNQHELPWRFAAVVGG